MPATRITAIPHEPTELQRDQRRHYRIATDCSGEQGHFLLRWESINQRHPVITCHPANAPCYRAVACSTSATGTALTYKWLFNGVELAG
jgi:hypothetical protein